MTAWGHERREGDEMSTNATMTMAPDFALPDFRGRMVRLSDFRGAKHVALVFNRGFM